MRRATITIPTIPDDLERSIEAHANDQEVSPSLTGSVKAALRLTPFPEGSGFSNTGIDHNEILIAEYASD